MYYGAATKKIKTENCVQIYLRKHFRIFLFILHFLKEETSWVLGVACCCFAERAGHESLHTFGILNSLQTPQPLNRLIYNLNTNSIMEINKSQSCVS